MKNNSHGESKESRLKRFQEGPPYEVISTLINSVANFFNNEIRLTAEGGHYQTSLMFLGIHASALTISEALFNKSGLEGYKAFLESFVDGNTVDTKFSSIASLIHNWRNTLAHQWIGSVGHQIGYDYDMSSGWEEREGIIFINPRVYLNHYLAAFEDKIYEWNKLLTVDEQEEAKQRLIKKYLEN